MKKILIVLFAIITFNSHAQVAVKLLDFQPRGDQAFFMKRNFAGEVMYLAPFKKKKLRSRIGLEIVSLHPRLDTFNYTTSGSDSQGDVICPAYIVFHKYTMYKVFLGFDLPVIRNKSFIGYAGLDLALGELKYDYTQYNIDRGGEVLFHNAANALMEEIRFRIGCEYLPIENVGIFAELTPAFSTMKGNVVGNYFFTYDIGVGIHFIIFN